LEIFVNEFHYSYVYWFYLKGSPLADVETTGSLPRIQTIHQKAIITITITPKYIIYEIHI